MEDKKIRVLVGKVGLDSHDRGARFVAGFLRDSGMEVIYMPRFQTPEAIIETAIQEDVDVIGLSFLSGEYAYYVPKIIESLKERGMKEVMVVLGGLIMDEDIPKLQEIGVKGIFRSGSTGEEIATFIKEQLVA